MLETIIMTVVFLIGILGVVSAIIGWKKITIVIVSVFVIMCFILMVLSVALLWTMVIS